MTEEKTNPSNCQISYFILINVCMGFVIFKKISTLKFVNI